MSWLAPFGIYTICKFSLLFTGAIMYRHDAFKHLSFFSYFIDNFEGVIPPTWSPYTHSGEPFYLYVPVNGLLHPAAILSVLVHRLFPSLSFVTLNIWEIFCAFIFYSLGCHLLLSRFCRNGFAMTMANTAIIFGTTGLSMWHQLQGSLDVIEFLPWILLCVHWSFTEQKWHRLIYAAIFLGAATCTYIPVFVLFYLAVTILFGSAEMIFRRQYPQLKNPRGFIYCLLGAGCAAAITALPAMALLQENANLVPIARLASQSSVVANGVQLADDDPWAGASYSTLADLKTPFLPSRIINSEASEVAPYVGTIPFCLAVIGLLALRRRGCPTLLCSTVLLALTSLGPLTPLAPWLRHYIPGFSFVRHLFMFAPFIAFNLAIFCLYGVEFLTELLSTLANSAHKNARRYLLAIALLIGTLCCLPTFMAAPFAISGWTLLLLVSGVGLVCFFSLARFGALTTAEALLLTLAWIEVFTLHARSQEYFSAPRSTGFSELSSTKFHYNPRRFITAQPVLPLNYSERIYTDFCVSMGEPLLFSIDTAFFADNLRYFMLRNYYEFTGGVFNAQNVTPQLAEKLGLEHPKLELTPSDAGTIALTEYHPNSISLDITLTSPATLLYRNVDDGHWQQAVDGKRQPIGLKDNVFPTLDMAAGKHSLTLTHRPWMFLIGFYGLTTGYLVLMFGAVQALYLSGKKRNSGYLLVSPPPTL